MLDGMQYDPIQGQGKGHKPLKIENSAIFKGYLLPLFMMGAGKWLRILQLGHNTLSLSGPDFLFLSNFLCHVTLQLAVRRSRPSVPYGANFVNVYRGLSRPVDHSVMHEDPELQYEGHSGSPYVIICHSCWKCICSTVVETGTCSESIDLGFDDTTDAKYNEPLTSEASGIKFRVQILCTMWPDTVVLVLYKIICLLTSILILVRHWGLEERWKHMMKLDNWVLNSERQYPQRSIRATTTFTHTGT